MLAAENVSKSFGLHALGKTVIPVVAGAGRGKGSGGGAGDRSFGQAPETRAGVGVFAKDLLGRGPAACEPRARLCAPGVLARLLDEPTASLDAETRPAVRDLFWQATARGTAILGPRHNVAARAALTVRGVDSGAPPPGMRARRLIALVGPSRVGKDRIMAGRAADPKSDHFEPPSAAAWRVGYRRRSTATGTRVVFPKGPGSRVRPRSRAGRRCRRTCRGPNRPMSMQRVSITVAPETLALWGHMAAAHRRGRTS